MQSNSPSDDASYTKLNTESGYKPKISRLNYVNFKILKAKTYARKDSYKSHSFTDRRAMKKLTWLIFTFIKI